MSKIYGSCKSAIYSSKLFKASQRKDKIKAALENPINVEFVKQLDEYIGDEYKSNNSSKAVEPKSEESHTADSKIANNSSETSDTFKLTEKYGDSLDADGEAGFDETQVSLDSDLPNTDDTDDESVPADSSTIIKKPYIVADTIVTKPFVENHVTISGLAGELKGTLNARADTLGVLRVSVKNDEVWIYYNDDTNLNNVMSPVIEILTAANYHYLIFNRLARTDNAIVFTINSNDTLNALESV